MQSSETAGVSNFLREAESSAFEEFRKKTGTNEKSERTSSEGDFHITLVRDESAIAELAQDWQMLLATNPGPEKIYQSPAFFQYLKETADPLGEPYGLLVARRRSDGKVIGIMPARMRQHPVEFRAGKLGCWTRKLPVVQLLGSVPMIADDAGLREAVVDELLNNFPAAHAVSMQAMPAEAFAQFKAMRALRCHVIDGWRECHTTPLPPSFEAYLQKFSAKKRYNLTRQVRLLAKEAGPLQVTRVEHPEQAGLLLEAVRALIPARAFAALPCQQRFERLAANGLLLSYVVSCGGKPVGAIVASNGIDKWMVHNIFSAQRYHHLSAGTSTLHLALEDVINGFAFKEADFGYGTPNRDFRATHVLRTRGHLLLYRAAGIVPWLLACHAIYGRLNSSLGGHIKRLQRRVAGWRAPHAN